jgi:hypothetical protein
MPDFWANETAPAEELQVQGVEVQEAPVAL